MRTKEQVKIDQAEWTLWRMGICYLMIVYTVRAQLWITDWGRRRIFLKKRYKAKWTNPGMQWSGHAMLLVTLFSWVFRTAELLPFFFVFVYIFQAISFSFKTKQSNRKPLVRLMEIELLVSLTPVFFLTTIQKHDSEIQYNMIVTLYFLWFICISKRWPLICLLYQPLKIEKYFY